jgi:hypothetical protein
VQQAATALEGRLQQVAGSGVGGERLAIVFSAGGATTDSQRLRFGDLTPGSQTSKSAQEGAAALVRGVFMAIRNLVSHPGWPDPPADEALEMLATMSYLARLIDRADLVHG